MNFVMALDGQAGSTYSFDVAALAEDAIQQLTSQAHWQTQTQGGDTLRFGYGGTNGVSS